MRRLLAIVFSFVIVVLPNRASAADLFSLEKVMSAPFPSDMVAAPAEGRLAWVFTESGARNVWIAEPPDYRARRLTAYTEDDGQDISNLTWTSDGRNVLYVRGGEHLGGEYPNPRSQPAGAQTQGIWAIAVSGGKPRLIAEGHSPTVCPRHSRVVFLRKSQIWWMPLEGKPSAQQLLHLRGSCSQPRWSPDGLQLAFVSSRGDHAFIGVYDWSAKSVRWLDPSVDRDSDPVWSPDGKEVAFLRQAATAPVFFGPKRSGEPWSIRIAQVANGSGREVFHAGKGSGSVFHQLVMDNQLLWGEGNQLVFPWERDGWSHLYGVAATGGEAKLLTPGEFEVEYARLSPDRKRVLFNSNQNDLERRHLWSVAVTGGPPTPLTSGQGIEWAPAMTCDGKAIGLLRSDARRPARPAIQIGSTSVRDLAPETISSDFPEQALVEPQAIQFSAADGRPVYGQLFLPPGVKRDKAHPAAIFFHGGSRRQMLLGWHYMDYYHNCYALNQYMASRGYVVLSVNYRSGIGYGMRFREAPNYGATGASEFQDVLGAGLYLQNRPEVDAKRIGLWGGSYGGYLTALGLARASDLFAAGVDIHGVYDWNITLRNFDSTYDPRADPGRGKLAYDSSPAAHMKGWRSPVLVIHGDDDRNVPFRESVQLVVDLRKQGVTVEQLIFPDEVHGFLTHGRWLEAFRASADFFDRRLKPPVQSSSR